MTETVAVLPTAIRGQSSIPAPSAVLERAFSVLAAFSADKRMRSMMEISHATGLPKSTTHRVLAQLVDLGVLKRVGYQYSIGARVFTLGTLSAEETLRELALPHLQALHRQSVGSGVNLAVLRGANVVYLERLSAPGHGVDLRAMPGEVPAHCTAVGKMLLASLGAARLAGYFERPLMARTRRSIVDQGGLLRQLEAARDTGLAFEREECYFGVQCVASSITLGTEAIAAVSISCPAGVVVPKAMGALLRHTSHRISCAASGAPLWDFLLNDTS